MWSASAIKALLVLLGILGAGFAGVIVIGHNGAIIWFGGGGSGGIGAPGPIIGAGLLPLLAVISWAVYRLRTKGGRRGQIF